MVASSLESRSPRHNRDVDEAVDLASLPEGLKYGKAARDSTCTALAPWLAQRSNRPPGSDDGGHRTPAARPTLGKANAGRWEYT